MPTKLYILQGRTGEDDSAKQWLVCGSTNRQLLEYHKILCEKERDRVIEDIHKLKEPSHKYRVLLNNKDFIPHKYDSLFQCEDSYTVYFIEESNLLGEIKGQ